MPGIGDRQSQKLESPEERQAAVFRALFPEPGEGPFNFAADVGQLFDERKLAPSARPRGSDAVRQSFHQPGDDLDDPFADFGIIDTAGAVCLARTDIDHRVELDAVGPLQFGVDIDPPEAFLAGSALQEQSFLVGVELAVRGHDPPLHIHHAFDQVAEQAAGHRLGLVQGDRTIDDPHRSTIP
ncbi:MAG: hypothetical protein MZV64_64520 [Ignavibacteriales bacterium]|nr:hypothetical protein [Ignavibacteriales bacterium]